MTILRQSRFHKRCVLYVDSAMSRPCLWRTGKGLLESQYPRSSFRIVDWQVYYARLTVYPFQKKGTDVDLSLFKLSSFVSCLLKRYAFVRIFVHPYGVTRNLQWREEKESYESNFISCYDRGEVILKFNPKFMFAKRMIERCKNGMGGDIYLLKETSLRNDPIM